MGFADLLAVADRAVLKHLGGSVTYQPEGGVAVPVEGVFDAAYVKVDVGQAGVSSAGPAVFALLADLPTDPEEDEPVITVDGVGYTVREVKKDGQGGVHLLLH